VPAVAAASQGNGVLFAKSVDASTLACVAELAADAVAGDEVAFDTPAACETGLLSPLQAASPTVIPNNREINPIPLDIMTSSYKTALRMDSENLVVQTYLPRIVTDQAGVLRNRQSFPSSENGLPGGAKRFELAAS
jgi:hypothetical protein